MADDSYDYLPLLHKVEVFQYALDNTTGQDLYRILWLRSRNSESWLERRVTYTRSLAVNSMVGYILGLGDRHPSNLLLDQVTGKVVHIDFVRECRSRELSDIQGDCFEVAQQRDKYPEKVPFRLTRMLIHAMEVSSSFTAERITDDSGVRYQWNFSTQLRDFDAGTAGQSRVGHGCAGGVCVRSTARVEAQHHQSAWRADRSG